MAGATAAQRLEEAHASPRNIRNLINEARDTGGWAGFRSVLEDLDPTPQPPSSSTEDDASASDSDVDESAGDVPTCSICLDRVKKVSSRRVLTCAHVFHASCIAEWLQRSNRCPLCRTEQ